MPPAHATDARIVDVSGAPQPDGRFLRLGLAKSAVIKLPAEAKDVIVGDDSIVDVVLRNRNMAYLFARKSRARRISSSSMPRARKSCIWISRSRWTQGA